MQILSTKPIPSTKKNKLLIKDCVYCTDGGGGGRERKKPATLAT